MKDYINRKKGGEIELKLNKFLNKKPLFYNKIDYNRMPNCWKEIKKSFKLPKK